MVNVTKGVLIRCDPAIKQYISKIEKDLKGCNLIHLDDCHIFVVNGTEEQVRKIQEKIDQLQDEITFQPEEASAAAGRSRGPRKPRGP